MTSVSTSKFGFFLLPSVLMAFLHGCLNPPIWSGSESRNEWAPARTTRRNEQPEVLGESILFVIDDSSSMIDKQKVLIEALEKARGVWSTCIGPDGQELVPSAGVCPDGYASKGYTVLSTGLAITTSLEGGGAICSDRNRGAYPLGTLGVDDPLDQIASAGENGCGFEAPLESVYRFLVDPDPPLLVNVIGEGSEKRTQAEGIDTELLARRAEFLFPYASLKIVILTDEDDCSVLDSGDGWKMGDDAIPRGTSACARDSASPCCRSCDASESTTPEGCAPLSEDNNCQAGPMFDSNEAPLNTRCWDQKRRFGDDYLFPVSRYTEALSSPTISNRKGERVNNPIFKNGTTPDMVSVLVLSGVPWQLLTKPEGPGRALEFLSSSELQSNGVWSKILGEPAQGLPPTDPHLIESVEPRAGLPLPGTNWDPVHGHEVVWSRKDSLQYSCVFDLPEPDTCTKASGCTCDPRLGEESPLCRQEDGSYGEPQRFAGAYPPIRLMEFARSLGERAAVGSICPKQLEDPQNPGYGYYDFIQQAFLNRKRIGFQAACFSSSLPVEEDGTPKCKLIEFHRDLDVECASLGRIAVSNAYRDPFGLKPSDYGTLCEIPRMPGDPTDPASNYFRCANELHPTLEAEGYCYIDTKLGLGAPELVVPCIDSHKRFFRSIPAALSSPGSTSIQLVCDYRE